VLHGGETSVWADKGYVAAERAIAFSGPGQFWGVMRKAPKGSNLQPLDESTNRIIAKVRAKVGYPFSVIKCQFGHVKTRYCGLAKNQAQLFTLLTLARVSRAAKADSLDQMSLECACRHAGGRLLH
jgi:IS5 family transposase